MSKVLTIRKSLPIAGNSFEQNKQVTVNYEASAPATLAPAKTGTLTTRTNNSDGTLTMTAGHGFLTGQRLDLYWTGGSRRGVVIGTVSVNSVPISGGSGDNLPNSATAITGMVPTSFPFSFTGDDLLVLAFYSGAIGMMTIVDDADSEILNWYNEGETVREWDTYNGEDNPVAGDVPFSVYLSHGNSTASFPVYAGFAI